MFGQAERRIDWQPEPEPQQPRAHSARGRSPPLPRGGRTSPKRRSPRRSPRKVTVVRDDGQLARAAVRSLRRSGSRSPKLLAEGVTAGAADGASSSGPGVEVCWFLAARGHPAYLGESVCEALAAALIPMHEWLDELHAIAEDGELDAFLAMLAPAASPEKQTEPTEPAAERPAYGATTSAASASSGVSPASSLAAAGSLVQQQMDAEVTPIGGGGGLPLERKLSDSGLRIWDLMSTMTAEEKIATPRSYWRAFEEGQEILTAREKMEAALEEERAAHRATAQEKERQQTEVERAEMEALERHENLASALRLQEGALQSVAEAAARDLSQAETRNEVTQRELAAAQAAVAEVRETEVTAAETAARELVEAQKRHSAAQGELAQEFALSSRQATEAAAEAQTFWVAQTRGVMETELAAQAAETVQLSERMDAEVLASRRDHAQAMALAESALERVRASCENLAPQKLRVRGVMKSMYTWRGFVARKVALRNLCRKVIKRVKHMVLLSAFAGWASACGRKDLINRKAVKVILRMQRLPLSAALAGWAVFVVNKKKQMRVLVHMREFVLRSVIVRWSVMAGDAIFFRTVGEKIMRRVRHLAIAKSFGAMADWTWKAKRVNAMASRWRHRQVLSAFEGWGEVIAYEITEREWLDERAKVEQQRSEDRSQFQSELTAAEERIVTMNTRILMSAAQKMKLRGAMKCVSAWRGFVMKKVAVRNLLRKVVKRLLKMALSCAFRGWASSCQRKVLTDKMALKVILRMQRLPLSAALSSWVTFVAIRKKQMRVLTHMRDVRLRSVLVKWSLVAHELIFFRTATEKIVHRARHLAAAKAFGAIVHWTHTTVRVNAMVVNWRHRQT